jgi:hypothetical protein
VQILLDSDAAVGTKYLDADRAIPLTVVIDKKGIVHKALSLGEFPDEDKGLNEEIDAALKDK